MIVRNLKTKKILKKPKPINFDEATFLISAIFEAYHKAPDKDLWKQRHGKIAKEVYNRLQEMRNYAYWSDV